MLLLRVFWSGFLIVLITSVNVGQISQGHLWGAMVGGGLLSWVWWGNTHRAAAASTLSARVAYAFGAATGTLGGMLLTRWLYDRP